MDRDIPTFNPIVVSRMQQKKLELHHQRLQNIKSFQQSRIATSATHPNRHNKKALQQEQDKKTEIERNNLILFNKMLRIMKRNDPCNQPPTHLPRPNPRASGEFTRIHEQNRTMYERIERQKPTIDNKKLYEQRKKQENILRFLGKYSAHSLQNAQTQSFRGEQPPPNQNPQRKPLKSDHYLYKIQDEEMVLQRPVRYDQIELEQELDEQQFNAEMQSYHRSKKTYSTSHTTNQLTNKPDINSHTTTKINTQTTTKYDSQTTKYDSLHSNQRRVPKSAKDIILFKSLKQICQHKYEIKIVRSHLAYEIRAMALGQDLPTPGKLVLSENYGNQLLQENGYDYRRIVQKITVHDGQLIFADDQQQQSPEQLQEHQDMFPPQLFQRTKKPQQIYHNPSHISEQNEEDSYRPPESIVYSPGKANPRVDSLGQEEHYQVVTQQANHAEQEEQEGEQAESREKERWQVKGGVGGVVNIENIYEQALDQQII